MLVLKNRSEVNSLKRKFPKSIMMSLEEDINIIENEYEVQSDTYGPLIIMIDEGEETAMVEKYNVLKNLVHEELEVRYMDEKEIYYRTVYLLTDSGFVVYIRKEK